MIRHPIRFFSAKAPFSYIICSEDGTPARHVLTRYFHKKTPRVIWLNGVQKTLTNERRFPAKTLTFLFVGRFERDKGILEFIRAIREIHDVLARKGCKAVIVGYGSLGLEVESYIQENGLFDIVELKGKVCHSRIVEFFTTSDVYVSLNELGNLSNTVLEALAKGRCTILLKGDGCVDQSTDELLPDDTVIRVDRRNITRELARTIKRLVEDPQEIDRRARKTKAWADTHLISWEDRIDRELAILQKIGL